MKIWLNLADILSIYKLFLFYLFELPSDTHSKVSWKFHKDQDLIWLRYCWSKNVCFMIVIFCYYSSSHLGIPTGFFIEHFVKITWFIWGNVNMKKIFICLFVFSFEWFLDTHRKIFWKFPKDWTWFSCNIVSLKHVYLYVYLFFVFIWIISEYPIEDFLKVLLRSDLI